MNEDGGFVFEPGSYELGASRIHGAGADLELAGDGYAAVQGRASEQLRQWLPTVPVADSLDQVEAKLAEATRLGAADLRQTGDKLLTARSTMLRTEAEDTALAEQAGRELSQPGLGSLAGDAGTEGTTPPNRIEQLLNGESAGRNDKVNAEIDQTLERVNPKYDPAKSAYSENCTGVVQANELRRRGLDVQAGPLEKQLRMDEGGPGGRSVSAIETPWGGKFKPGTKAEIEAAFAQPGSRGVVLVEWGLPASGAHVFNVENVGGQVRFLDGQPTPPVTDASRYFALGRNSWYIRLDDRPTPPPSATQPYLETDGSLRREENIVRYL